MDERRKPGAEGRAAVPSVTGSRISLICTNLKGFGTAVADPPTPPPPPPKSREPRLPTCAGWAPGASGQARSLSPGLARVRRSFLREKLTDRMQIKNRPRKARRLHHRAHNGHVLLLSLDKNSVSHTHTPSWALLCSFYYTKEAASGAAKSPN